jgi:hypothetical protein
MAHLKIIYEPHPLHPARKAKLQEQGYKIIDAIFAPAGTPLHEKLEEEVSDVEPEAEPVEDTLVAYEEEAEDAPAKRGRSKKG